MVYRISRDFLIPAITHHTPVKERHDIPALPHRGVPGGGASRVLNEAWMCRRQAASPSCCPARARGANMCSGWAASCAAARASGRCCTKSWRRPPVRSRSRAGADKKVASAPDRQVDAGAPDLFADGEGGPLAHRPNLDRRTTDLTRRAVNPARSRGRGRAQAAARHGRHPGAGRVTDCALSRGAGADPRRARSRAPGSGGGPDRLPCQTGLAHLLASDFSTFEVGSPLEPSALRQRVFALSAPCVPSPQQSLATLTGWRTPSAVSWPATSARTGTRLAVCRSAGGARVDELRGAHAGGSPGALQSGAGPGRSTGPATSSSRRTATTPASISSCFATSSSTWRTSKVMPITGLR